MKYPKTIENPFGTQAEFNAWAFGSLAGAWSVISQYEAEDDKRKADRLSELFSDEKAKRKRREVNPETRAVQIESLAREMRAAWYPQSEPWDDAGASVRDCWLRLARWLIESDRIKDES